MIYISKYGRLTDCVDEEMEMEIEEYDVFNYVFNPAKLPKDKYDFIEENEELFAREIRFTRAVKDSLIRELSAEKKAELRSKFQDKKPEEE